MYYTYKETPGGTVLLTKDGERLTGLYWKIFKRTPVVGTSWIEDAHAFDDVSEQLDEYYEGARHHFDLQFGVKGTDFQKEVWRALEAIPYGKIASYAAIAEAVGRPKAVRAVGTAIGSNPICIIVPCHRVLTSDGKIGGYAGGVSAKRGLLQTEGISL